MKYRSYNIKLRQQKTVADLADQDQSTKVLSTNNFHPSYFAVQGSQSTNVLSAKLLSGS